MAAANTKQHDVVVVGAGVIGLACAWRAAERGLRVLVLERDRPGAGASNVAAGMLAPVGEATFGEDRLLELALGSHRLWPRFAADLAATGEVLVSEERAADVLWLAQDIRNYDWLVRERGWPVERFERWFVDGVAAVLGAPD